MLRIGHGPLAFGSKGGGPPLPLFPSICKGGGPPLPPQDGRALSIKVIDLGRPGRPKARRMNFKRVSDLRG